MAMEQSLLSSVGDEETWQSYQNLESAASIQIRPVSGADLSAEDLRSASLFSQSYYPPSLHAALVNSSGSDHGQDNALVHHDGYGGEMYGTEPNVMGKFEHPTPMLDEVEARQLLIDHVGHHWCWGSQPARSWKINAMEDCNVYVGTLETFIEEREAMREVEPFKGGKFDGRDRGPELGLWELDLRSEFPSLYVPLKETKVNVPHSEAVEKCSGCKGQGQVACANCIKFKQCTHCYGRGLLAHRDGSDTLCIDCGGKGMIPCVRCGTRGLIPCLTCDGGGLLLSRIVAVVRWRTLKARRVSAAGGAASVPEEVLHRAIGVELCNNHAHQCGPAFFPGSYLLNRFSSEVIAARVAPPAAARGICERHVISVVPVTRVTMADRRQSFSFYVVGLGREVFVRDYPSRLCWVLCCCLDWLKL